MYSYLKNNAHTIGKVASFVKYAENLAWKTKQQRIEDFTQTYPEIADKMGIVDYATFKTAVLKANGVVPGDFSKEIAMEPQIRAAYDKQLQRWEGQIRIATTAIQNKTPIAARVERDEEGRKYYRPRGDIHFVSASRTAAKGAALPEGWKISEAPISTGNGWYIFNADDDIVGIQWADKDRTINLTGQGLAEIKGEPFTASHEAEPGFSYGYRFGYDTKGQRVFRTKDMPVYSLSEVDNTLVDPDIGGANPAIPLSYYVAQNLEKYPPATRKQIIATLYENPKSRAFGEDFVKNKYKEIEPDVKAIKDKTLQGERTYSNWWGSHIFGTSRRDPSRVAYVNTMRKYLDKYKNTPLVQDSGQAIYTILQNRSAELSKQRRKALNDLHNGGSLDEFQRIEGELAAVDELLSVIPSLEMTDRPLYLGTDKMTPAILPNDGESSYAHLLSDATPDMFDLGDYKPTISKISTNAFNERVKGLKAMDALLPAKAKERTKAKSYEATEKAKAEAPPEVAPALELVLPEEKSLKFDW